MDDNNKDIRQLRPEVNSHKDLEFMFKQLVQHSNIRLYPNYVNACLFLVKNNERVEGIWDFRTTVFNKCQGKYCVNNLGFQGMNYKGVNYQYTLNVAIKMLYSSN